MMTTKLKHIKSYPTYQLHTYTNNKRLPAEEVLKICILETMKWLRSRLSLFADIPTQLDLPEPENYRQLSFEMLHSFSLNIGSVISVVFIEKKGLWSFDITESDMGENIGTATERPPVNGRTFSTDISFIINGDRVETGIRTICSEPSDTSAPCRVFRPAIVKMLAENKLVGLRCEYELDGSVINIGTKSEAGRFIDAVQDKKFSLPTVIVAEPPFETPPKKQELSLPKLKALLDKQLSEMHLGTASPDTPSISGSLSSIKVDISHLGFESRIPKTKAPESEETKSKKSEHSDETAECLQTFDYSSLAKKTIGFAFVCFIEESCFDYFAERTGIKLNCGNVLIIDHNVVIEKYPFDIILADNDEFYKRLKEKVLGLPMRNTADFGNVVFLGDARLLEIEEKKKQNITSEEKCELLLSENKELKRKISELERNSAASTEAADELRRVKRSLREKEEELEVTEEKYRRLEEKYNTCSDAFYNSSAMIRFYRKKSAAAAYFPTDIANVSEWAEKHLGEYIEIAPKAKSELKKYSGSLDVGMLCDGLYFLSGYARFKTGKADRETLELYAEYAGWEVQGCGKEALKCFRDDYTLNIDGRKMLMDRHIKYGIKSQTLIRIYFCWDDKNKKVAVGYMPGHLPTVRNST